MALSLDDSSRFGKRRDFKKCARLEEMNHSYIESRRTGSQISGLNVKQSK